MMRLYRRKPGMVEAIEHTGAVSAREIARRLGVETVTIALLLPKGSFLVRTGDEYEVWSSDRFHDVFEPILPYDPSLISDGYAHEFADPCADCGEATYTPAEHTCGRTPEGDLPLGSDSHEDTHGK